MIQQNTKPIADADNSVRTACPSGHRLRGDASMIGKTIRCPKCKKEFIFQSEAVTDTGVMRILGDATPPATKIASKADQDSRTRPCPRCETSIQASANVCRHCHCYVGSMPDFMASGMNEC